MRRKQHARSLRFCSLLAKVSLPSLSCWMWLYLLEEVFIKVIVALATFLKEDNGPLWVFQLCYVQICMIKHLNCSCQWTVFIYLLMLILCFVCVHFWFIFLYPFWTQLLLEINKWSMRQDGLWTTTLWYLLSIPKHFAVRISQHFTFTLETASLLYDSTITFLLGKLQWHLKANFAKFFVFETMDVVTTP